MSTTVELNPIQSHSKIGIETRRVKFDYHDIESADLYSGNMLISALWVGLSASFPLGEAEFIRSVRFFEKQITDDKLKREVEAFATQEAHHALQHKKVNQQFDTLGFDTKKIEKIMTDKINDRIVEWSPKKRLMRTVAAEHFTAVMAHYTLTFPQSLGAVPASFRNLFLWHSIEEIEHKSVAFDVYKHCVGDMRALRWHYAKFAFFEFPMNVYAMSRFLLKNMGYKGTKQERKGLRKFLFGKEGIIGSAKGLYLMFLKKDFHPWHHDDSALVEHWKTELAEHFTH